MKSQTEPVMLTNAVVSILLFAMLTLGLGTKISDINLMQTWADASSFANSITSRAYTSADCFAYETMIVKEHNGNIVSERRVYPGIIDVRKFTEDDYFSCIENYYSVSGSEIDFMTKNVPAQSLFLINFKLYDLENPQMIRELGDTMSNEEQLDWGISQEWIEGQRQYLQSLTLFADTASMIASIAFTLLPLPFEIEPVVKIGNIYQNSDIDNNVVQYIKSSYSMHTTTIPVILRYVNDEGNLITDHQGILETNIKYSSGAFG